MKEAGKDLQDVHVMTNVGDVPIQEMRACGKGEEYRKIHKKNI